MYCCSGVLFPHESERSNSTSLFLSIIKSAIDISKGSKQKLLVKSLGEKYDWGYARDYVECMWLMLQQPKPEDCIIATKKLHTLRELCILSFKKMGIELVFSGIGKNEKGIDASTGKVIVEICVDSERQCNSIVQNNAEPLPKLLEGWEAKVGFEELVNIVCERVQKVEN